MTDLFHVITTAHGVRGYADGGGREELTLDRAYKVALLEQEYYQSKGLKAKIEIVFIKPNGQHGDTISLFNA